MFAIKFGTIQMNWTLSKTIVLMINLLWSLSVCSVEVDPVLLYQAHYEKSLAGVYDKDDWLFIIAEVPTDSDKQPKIHYEAKTMLQTQHLLKQFILKQMDFSVLKSHDFHGRLAADFDELLVSGDFYNFSINAISVRLLENKGVSNKYRRVTALKKNELSKVKINLSAILNKLFVVNYLLNNAYENNELLASYYFNLGLLREAYFYKWQQLRQRYYLVNYPLLDKKPFQSRQLLRRVLEADSKDYQLDWLKQIPANTELFAEVQDDIGGMDPLGQGLLDWLLASNLPEEDYQKQLEKVLKRLDNLTPNSLIKAEFKFLQKNSLQIKKMKDSQPILQVVLNQQGFLVLDAGYSNKSNTFFEQAIDLFKQGRNIDKVLILLQQSVEESPRHAESWVYLGSVWKYKKDYINALAAFQQASLLNHGDIENQANIAEIYLELNQIGLAKAYLYYLQQQPAKKLSVYTQKIISRLINFEDKE